MLTKVEVGPGWHRYKSDEPVQSGLYYASSSKIQNPELRRGLSCLAVQDPSGRFKWLMPFERWIKRALEGYTPPEAEVYGLSRYESTVRPLRSWQKGLLADVHASVDRVGYYRRGVVAPLGAGKTLAGLMVAKDDPRALVVAPSHLHVSWRREAAQWDLPCPRLSTYESIHKHDEARVIIFDEVLAVKNPATARHTKALAMAAKAQIAVGFTGTPSSVSPTDLRWLRAIYPGCVPENEVAWRHLWGLDTELVEVAPEKKVYVTKTWDSKSISNFVEPFMAVVPLDEIAKELPNVTYQTIHVPCPRRFDLVLKGGATESGRAKALAQARQLSDGFIYDDTGGCVEISTEKFEALDELIGGLGEACVVYAAWDATVTRLAERYRDRSPAVLRGGNDYTNEVGRFLDGRSDLLLANARIATGLNLQRARVMVFVSNSTSPVDRVQAEGRIIRPGQKSSGVVIYDIVADGTLDERHLELLKAHRDESEGFVMAALEKEFARRAKG